MNDIARSSSPPVFLAGGGEMGKLIRKHDWSAASLGPLETWPQSLRVILGFLLRSPVPMVLLWGEDGIMLYNDAYSVFAGSRHPELLGSKVRDGWPEVVAFNDNVMQVVLAGGTLHYRGQELVLHRAGQPDRVWMNLDYSPVLDESGEPAGVLCVVAEITEQIAAEQRREAAEAALRAERDRSQRVLDNMGEAFVLLDREFRIVDMNAEAMRLENRPKEAILGKTHWEAHPDAAPELGELYRKAMREKRAVALEHRYVWPDGRDTWIDMRAYPVRDELAVFYRDVTDRKRTEEALRASDDRQRFLISLDNEVRGLVEPAAVVAATSRALGERLGAARVAYAEIDEANDRASVHGGWTDGTLAQLPGELRLSSFGPTMIALL
jgi:PAS domain S-box-containing protein